MIFSIMSDPTNDTLVGGTVVSIVAAIIIIAIHTAIWVVNKENPKVDQGFCLTYYKLSYRRRFIRDIWSLPFAFLILMLAIKYVSFNLSAIGAAILTMLILLAVINVIYNYKMWKRHETKKER